MTDSDFMTYCHSNGFSIDKVKTYGYEGGYTAKSFWIFPKLPKVTIDEFLQKVEEEFTNYHSFLVCADDCYMFTFLL